MENKRFLFITQEIAPYLPDSTVATLGNTLPQGLQELGYEVRNFMPKYGRINERRNQLHEVIRLSGINISINDADHPLIIKVASMLPTRIQVYFIDNDDYFQKSADDVDPVGSNRTDNNERIIFYTRGSLETVKKLRWEPFCVFCQGWIASLTPLYIRALYDGPIFDGSKIVYSVVPGEFDGTLGMDFADELQDDGIPADMIPDMTEDGPDTNDMHRLAIQYSDAVVISDPDADPSLEQYARELGKPVLIAPIGETTPEQYAEFLKSL